MTWFTPYTLGGRVSAMLKDNQSQRAVIKAGGAFADMRKWGASIFTDFHSKRGTLRAGLNSIVLAKANLVLHLS
jgi:hypothetical protein